MSQVAPEPSGTASATLTVTAELPDKPGAKGGSILEEVRPFCHVCCFFNGCSPSIQCTRRDLHPPPDPGRPCRQLTDPFASCGRHLGLAVPVPELHVRLLPRGRRGLHLLRVQELVDLHRNHVLQVRRGLLLLLRRRRLPLPEEHPGALRCPATQRASLHEHAANGSVTAPRSSAQCRCTICWVTLFPKCCKICETVDIGAAMHGVQKADGAPPESMEMDR